MIGRRALEHPFVFREARARLDHAPKAAAPSVAERVELCREHLLLLAAAHGPARALRGIGQWLPRYLGRLPAATEWLRELRSCPNIDAVLETLDCFERELQAEPSVHGYESRV
jgi:tRNA-dihydrouridine synthase